VRLFFAVQLADDVIARLSTYVDTLRSEAADSNVAWEPPEKLHYTLKFLGDVDVDELHMEALTHAAEVAREVAPFELSPGALGAFPDHEGPRILWLGVDEGLASLCALAEKLEALLARQGYARETRPYRPHLTLARAKGRAGEVALRRLLTNDRPRSTFGTTRIERFVLMQSSGGTYRERLGFTLGGTS
jgi:RNA 2',3'-cyclic 3'-phosphodiesterase